MNDQLTPQEAYSLLLRQGGKRSSMPDPQTGSTISTMQFRREVLERYNPGILSRLNGATVTEKHHHGGGYPHIHLDREKLMQIAEQDEKYKQEITAMRAKGRSL